MRWTEKRNFEAVLDALARKRLLVDQLITERIPLNEYAKIYGEIGSSKSIASILVYEEKETEPVHKISLNQSGSFDGQKGVIGIIGAGNFTSAMILPSLKKCKAQIKSIASSGGLSGTTMAKKFGIPDSTTDYATILNDQEIDTVFITTRHNAHAKMVQETLSAGKHVFVEKPLALNRDELSEIKNTAGSSDRTVTVGFNRRFAPLAKKLKQLLASNNTPVNIIATMNAGMIPPNVWVHDMEVGGGRIIGEACHYIDLCSYLTGSKVKAVCMNALGTNPEENTDNVSILLKYENGSNAVINYFANGSKAYSKERIEVYHQERTFVLDNWRTLRGYGVKGFRKASSQQDKGHFNQFQELMNTIQNGGKPLIPFDEIVNTTEASFAAIESLKIGQWIMLA